MRYSIIENSKVVNIAEADPDFAAASGWTENTGEGIGWILQGDGSFERPDPPPVKLGLLEIDKDRVTADATDAATVTLQSPEAVIFVVDDQVITVETVDNVAALEVTATAPGPILISAGKQSVMLVALEVTP